MIRHLSISAADPRNVAKVLAKLMDGQMAPFPVHAGTYVAAPYDQHGTLIEVHPLGTELVPGTGNKPLEFHNNTFASQFNALHFALDVPISQKQIEQIAANEGWRVLRCNRGPFELIEFWIENRLLVELFTPQLLAQYLKFMQPNSLRQVIAAANA